MIYADFNGSAPLSNTVIEYLNNRFKTGPFANPNAIHHMGVKTMIGMENARRVCASNLGADKDQIVFNSGATEGISTAFHSLLSEIDDLCNYTIIISGIEHSAVINTAKHYESKGANLEIIPTLETGIVNLEALKTIVSKSDKNIALIAVMAANNETGVIQPYKEIATLCNTLEIPFICDTTQFIGKAEFNFSESGIDFAFMSGHKIGALTGCGLMLTKEPTTLKPLIIGGGQEKGVRGGTQNYLGNETMAVALDCFSKNMNHINELETKRKEFESSLKGIFPNIVILGEDAPRLASTSYIAFPGIHGQAVQIELEALDIFVTTSSACSDNEPVTSKVLKSMGVCDDIGRGVVRISLSLCSPLDQYDTILTALTSIYNKLAKIKSF